MARIDSLLTLIDRQGANELRLGSDREPQMFARPRLTSWSVTFQPRATSHRETKSTAAASDPVVD